MNFITSKKLKNFKPLFLLVAVFVFCLNIQTVFAKEYYYKDFEVDIKINEDSSFDVTEKQIYYLDGSFGFFSRDVSFKDIDCVTDVEVFDGEGNKIPKSDLEISSGFGEKHIQWNFPRRNFSGEEKAWTVKYKVHGGISFLKNYDEIYWNAIPQNRDVIIENAKVTVSLPHGEKFRSDLIHLYSEAMPEALAQENCYFENGSTQAVFEGEYLEPNTNFTVAAGFSKGIVSQSSYWKDFLMMYYGYILSIIIFLSCVLIGFVYWYKTEKSREGKRAIVPQYEPPQNLRPAMAEVIVKEKLTSKGLAATIIDLAVRGYVKIEEEEKSKWEHITKNILKIVPIFLVIVLFVSFSTSSLDIPFSKSYFFISFILLPFIGLIIMYISALFIITPIENKKSDYIVTKIKSYEDNPDLEDYEKKYLKALFGSKEYFSTKEIRKDQIKARALYEKIKKVKDKIYEETELDTGAFEIGLTIEKRKKIIWTILAFGIFFLFGIFTSESNQVLFLVLTIIISVAGLYAFIKYEARLSNQGIKMKEDWLGFKMYLETAEKYRMQNLKPEFFEKYLPYAMIFGVEKKWAKAFEHLNMSSPLWYAGSAHAAAGSSLSSASSFSPLSFSNSFTSSFTSAFSNSGASGASGGGGGAGGGGGGGGAGAG